jgi:hypothetical protein
MAEIRNYTMNFNFDITCLRQVSLRCNKSLTRLVVDRNNDVLRPEVHG